MSTYFAAAFVFFNIQQSGTFLEDEYALSLYLSDGIVEE